MMGGRDRGDQRPVAAVFALASVGEQARDVAQVAGDHGAEVRGFGQTTRAVGTHRAEVRGTQQGGDRTGRVTSAAGGVGRVLEEARHPLVRPHGRVSQVPGPPLRTVRQQLGQQRMCAHALVHRGQVDHRRAGQRVAERHPVGPLVHFDQSGPFGRGQFGRCARISASTRSAPLPSNAASRSRCRVDVGRGRTRDSNAAWRRLVSGSTSGSWSAPDCSRLVSARGSSSRASGLPCASSEQAPPDPSRQSAGTARLTSASAAVVVERPDLMVGQPGAVEEALLARPVGGQETDRPSTEPTGDDREHHRARPIHPRQIVDDHQHRPCVPSRREQRQDRIGDHQQARRRTVAKPQRHADGAPVIGAQHVQLGQHRVQHLVKRREAVRRLELGTGGPQHPRPRGVGDRDGLGQQHRLPHTRVTDQQHRTTGMRCQSSEIADDGHIGTSTDQRTIRGHLISPPWAG